MLLFASSIEEIEETRKFTFCFWSCIMGVEVTSMNNDVLTAIMFVVCAVLIFGIGVIVIDRFGPLITYGFVVFVCMPCVVALVLFIRNRNQ